MSKYYQSSLKLGSILLVLLATAACSSGSDDPSEGNNSSDTNNTGDDNSKVDESSQVDATCDDWKESFCSLYDQCGSYSTCYADLADESCTADAPLNRCVTELNQGCDSIPDSCDPIDVLNTTTAISRCYGFANRFCESLTTCDSTVDVAQCVSEVEAQLLCDYSLYASANYDACIDALTDDTCETQLPDICAGVILK